VFSEILEGFAIKVYNSSKNNLIADDVNVAQNPFTRTIGLLFKKSLTATQGLVIKPCCSIHTFFMQFEIDVLFVNRKNEIIALYEKVKPYRILPIHFKSYYVIELASGSISAKNIQKGDILSQK